MYDARWYQKDNDEGFSTHFESDVVGEEIMTLNDDEFPKFSKFTLALLEDSGWYLPDYNMQDDLKYGYG